MRMWTQVLVENGGPPIDADRPESALTNTGQLFDAFYFIGPGDIHSFFQADGRNLGASIEQYFARKHSFERSFRDGFSMPGLDGVARTTEPFDSAASSEAWDHKRRAFLLFYAHRASTAYSLGSHDEWEISGKLTAGHTRHQFAVSVCLPHPRGVAGCGHEHGSGEDRRRAGRRSRPSTYELGQLLSQRCA